MSRKLISGRYLVRDDQQVKHLFLVRAHDPGKNADPEWTIDRYAEDTGETVPVCYIRLGHIIPFKSKTIKRDYVMVIDLLKHPQSAGQLYAQETGRCYACNRTLRGGKTASSGLGGKCVREMKL